MDYFIFALTVIGAIICSKNKHPEKNIFYYGFWFFVLFGLSEISSFITIIISMNIPSIFPCEFNSISKIGIILSTIGLIKGIIRAIGFIVLILGFYKYNSKMKIEE